MFNFSVPLLIIIIFVIEKLAALTYNQPCQTSCGFPGLVCVQGRCKCDAHGRLFWTGKRCHICPTAWVMSETECIGYQSVAMSWKDAAAACRTLNADLISIRDNSILPILYQATGNKRRKKRVSQPVDRTVVWSGAHAVQINGLSVFKWHDDTVPNFDSKSPLWCTPSTPNLGFQHPLTEPTRRNYFSQAEDCVLLRRGRTSTRVVCLDDIICNELHPFICQRTETTAQRYSGAPPTNANTNPTSTQAGSKTTTSTDTVTLSLVVDGEWDEKNPHALGALNGSTEPSILNMKNIILLIVGLLMLVGAIVGAVVFAKRRGDTSSTDGDHNKGDAKHNRKRASAISGSSVSEASDGEDGGPTGATPVISDLGLHSNIPSANLASQKAQLQKNKRSGYSKQKFDEFE